MAMIVRSVKRLAWLCVVAAIAANCANVNIGRVRLFVGNGVSNVSTNGTGVAAQINNPKGCGVTGNVLAVVEPLNHVVRSVDTHTAVTGVLVGTWNTSGNVPNPSGQSRIGSPYAVSFLGTAGYVVDFANNAIFRMTVGNPGLTLLAGATNGASGSADGTGSNATFASPFALAVRSVGDYMLVTQATNVRKVTLPGAVVTRHTGGAADAGYVEGDSSTARFSNPRGIVVLNTSVAYVADYDNRVIRRIDASVNTTTVAGSNTTTTGVDGTGIAASFKGPSGLVVDATAAFLFVADQADNKVRRITLSTFVVDTVFGNGTALFTSALLSTEARIAAPNSLCFNADFSRLYVTGDNGVSQINTGVAARTKTQTLNRNATTNTTTNGTTTNGTTTSANGTTTASANGTTTTSSSGTTTRAANGTTTTSPVATSFTTTTAPVNAAMSPATVAVAMIAAAVLALVA